MVHQSHSLEAGAAERQIIGRHETPEEERARADHYFATHPEVLDHLIARTVSPVYAPLDIQHTSTGDYGELQEAE